PTLSWTSPFVPDSSVSGSAPTSTLGRAPFQWELAATQAPRGSSQPQTSFGVTPGGSNPAVAAAITPFAFGAQSYHLQVARDSAFSNIVVDTTVAGNSFTVATDLNIATQYFWRVTATNACGTSGFSASGSFIVGACFEGWASGLAIPVTAGPSQSSVIA